MWTSSGSPRLATVSTSRAVEALSITPPGGATDSIRWAMPTWSPIAVYPVGVVPISPAITCPEFSPIRNCRSIPSRLGPSTARSLLRLGCPGRPGTPEQPVVLQRHRRAEHGHDPVAGELVHRPAIPFHHSSGPIDQLRHDLPQPLRPDGRGDVHGVHNIGEQDGHLLVLRWVSGLCDWRAALATELGSRAQLAAA